MLHPIPRYIGRAHKGEQGPLLGVGGWLPRAAPSNSVFEQATRHRRKLYRLGDAIPDHVRPIQASTGWTWTGNINVSNGSSERYENRYSY